MGSRWRTNTPSPGGEGVFRFSTSHVQLRLCGSAEGVTGGGVEFNPRHLSSLGTRSTPRSGGVAARFDEFGKLLVEHVVLPFALDNLVGAFRGAW